jgi:hypothetical protein
MFGVPKYTVNSDHVSDVELHLRKGLGEEDVESAPTVDEYLVEFGARDYWFQD